MLIIAVITINRKRSDAKQADLNKTFLERENEANATRRQDISVLKYIKIPERLTDPENEVLKELCADELKELKRLSDEKLLNLTIYSNTDLKLMYGPQNLDDLSLYDNNFTSFEVTVTSLARKCIDNDMEGEAIPYLEFAIAHKTTDSQIYVLLGNAYKNRGQLDKVQTLIDGLEGQEFLMKKTILEKLSQIVS